MSDQNGDETRVVADATSSQQFPKDFERKMRAILLVIGSVVGIGIGCLVGYSVGVFRTPALPEGASFESLDDLRRAMLTTDERDVKPDQNVSLRAIVRPDPSDLIIYRLKPNLSVKFQRVPVTTNSFGLRGPETTMEKPSGVFRIILLGDSFAFGWGVEEDQIFARVIERELNRMFPNGPRVEVLNFGVPGYSTFQEIALFEEFGLKFNPDLALVYYVENDFGLPFFVKNLANPTELARDKDFAEFREEQRGTEHDDKNRQLLKNLDPNRGLKKLLKIVQEHSIQAAVVINPGRRSDKDEERLWVARQNPELKLLSIRDEVRRIIDERGLDQSELQLRGDPHPSATKHKILGEVIAGRLAGMITPSKPPPPAQ